MAAAVVYIDDEPGICRIIELNMALRQVEVAIFTRALEAVEYINSHDVRVVFCDYQMPEMTGGELFDALERQVEFYLVTGGFKAFREDDLEDRVRGVLIKPLDFDELVGIVEQALLKPLGDNGEATA